MRIVANVTQRDIEKGTPEHTKLCPIARALKRKRGVSGVDVDSMDFSFVHDGLSFGGELSAEAQDFVHQFDDEEYRASAEPQRFVLEAERI